MNISDLSVDTLTQLEARMTADLEMVKRVKALVLEYQKMGGRGLLGQTGSLLAGSAATPAGAATTHSDEPASSPPKSAEERLTEALATMPSGGFTLDNLRRATHSPSGPVGKDTVKAWVKRMVRKGKINVLEIRAGRIGSLYAANVPEPSATGN